MAGLYERALQYRNQDGLLETGRSDLIFDEDSGIPIEEQKEILEQIEEVVAENKITITNDTLTIHPRKNGFLVPLLNLLGMTLLVAFFFLLLQNPFQQDTELNIEASGEETAAGTVLSKVREDFEARMEDLQAEAELKINEREAEIQRIESQLTNLDEEKRSLEENFQKDIEDKTRVLEEEMNQALEAERLRLQESGIAIVDIDARMAEKRAEFESDMQQQITQFRQQQEAELQARERELTNEINTMQSNLETERNQRLALETELNEQIEAERRAQQEAEADLLEAQQRVENLLQAQEATKRLNDQIFASYNVVQINLEEENLAAAKAKLSEMKNFFYKEEILQNPGITQNREMHLFLIDALEQFIETEEAMARIDTATLSEKAAVINNINSKFQQAETAYQRNDTLTAQKLYEEALAYIPDIKESYLKSVEIDDTRRENLFSQYLSQADNQLNSQSYANAITNYTEALKVAPASMEEEQVDALLTNLMEAGYQLKGSATSRQEEEQAAARVINQANNLLAGSSYADAVTKYLDVLTLYPRSSQVEAARVGIKTSLAEIQNLYETRQAADSRALSELEANLEAKEAEAADLKADLEESRTTVTSLNTRVTQQEEDIVELQATITSQRENLAELEEKIQRYTVIETSLQERIAELETINSNPGRTAEPAATPEPAMPVLSEELEQELEAYRALRAQMENLQDDYSVYTREEDEALANLGNVGYLSSRLKLRTLLNSEPVSSLMPDLFQRMRAFEVALAEDAEQAGSDTALENILEIMDDYLDLETAAARDEFWDNQYDQYQEDPLFLDLLDSLRETLSR